MRTRFLLACALFVVSLSPGQSLHAINSPRSTIQSSKGGTRAGAAFQRVDVLRGGAGGAVASGAAWHSTTDASIADGAVSAPYATDVSAILVQAVQSILTVFFGMIITASLMFGYYLLAGIALDLLAGSRVSPHAIAIFVVLGSILGTAGSGASIGFLAPHSPRAHAAVLGVIFSLLHLWHLIRQRRWHLIRGAAGERADAMPLPAWFVMFSPFPYAPIAIWAASCVARPHSYSPPPSSRNSPRRPQPVAAAGAPPSIRQPTGAACTVSLDRPSLAAESAKAQAVEPAQSKDGQSDPCPPVKAGQEPASQPVQPALEPAETEPKPVEPPPQPVKPEPQPVEPAPQPVEPAVKNVEATPVIPTQPEPPVKPMEPSVKPEEPVEAAPEQAIEPPGTTERTVVFRLKNAPAGERDVVKVCGNHAALGGWKLEDAPSLTKVQGEACWTLSIRLPFGSAEYKFVTGGQWESFQGNRRLGLSAGSANVAPLTLSWNSKA